MPSYRMLLALVGALLTLVRPATAQERTKDSAVAAREGIEAIEARLASAVDRVSLPHAARLLGRAESVRGYRLPGYGLVLVLTPRMLPGVEGQVYVLRGRSPKHRRIRVQSHPPGGGEMSWTVDDEQIETFERQVLVLQHETEAARRAAEEEMERIVEDMRVRVAPPSRVRGEVRTAPEAPAPPAPPPAPDAVVPPSAPVPPAPPAPPPWKNWFETRVPDERTPEVVIADVRAALIDALVAQGGGKVGLGGDERITVAVDFVPGGLFAAQARPGKTLVVSARVRDVDARTRGAITPGELRRRVEVTEY